ncbi:MAG: hypothetical protein ACYC6Y_02955 [Thermoguttaceae bacterium]
MSRHSQEPTWPFLCILACLFVLTAAAPRAWQKSIRTRGARLAVHSVVDNRGRHPEPEVDGSRADDREVPGDADAATLAGGASPDSDPSLLGVDDLDGADRLVSAVPHPRIALEAVDSAPAESAAADQDAEIESLTLLPPVGDDAAPQVADQDEAGLPASVAAPVLDPVAETPGKAADEIAMDSVAQADRGTGAVPGVAPLSPRQVADLAAQHAARIPREEKTDWTTPVSILERLKPLMWECDTGQWARRVAEAVTRAASDVAGNSAAATQSLARISDLARDGEAMAKERQGTDEFDRIQRVLTALRRAVDVWEKIADAGSGDGNRPRPIDWARVQRSIQNVRSLTGDGSNGLAWHSFLELESLAGIAARGATGLHDEDLTVVQLVLLKLQVKEITDEQRTLLESEHVGEFEEMLRAVVTRPIDAAVWVRCIEAFDRSGSPSLGEHLAVERLKLSLSSLPAHRRLAETLQDLYRGPNVRIAVTGYLLNRMLPDREPEYQWVRDTVLGHPVHGRSRTSAHVGLALIPDPARMRAALTVDGLVSASTSSTAGPATFFNDSESEYSAVKELELTSEGIEFRPAEATADNQTRLRQVRTDFDGIPLLSSLARSMAKSQLDKNRPAIRRETNRKVEFQAERQIDEEIDARLGELNLRLKNRLLDPLAAMSLRPEVDKAETTVSRMSMQLHLAAVTQLGANTPRPWAPSDSVLSFQLHQSALNNVLLGLKLDGATMTIKELRDLIGKRFNRPELLEETTEHDDALITFAAIDAARIDFTEDRIAVSLGVSRLRAGARQWSDFRVRACYRLQSGPQSASLVRDGVVELVGPMRMGSQIALRSIFSKTFAKGREFPIVPAEMAADPRLQGLEVTQLSADEGWFALAVGPPRLQPAIANSQKAAEVK